MNYKLTRFAKINVQFSSIVLFLYLWLCQGGIGIGLFTTLVLLTFYYSLAEQPCELLLNIDRLAYLVSTSNCNPQKR